MKTIFAGALARPLLENIIVRFVPLAGIGALMALAACAPEAGKTVAAIDPKTPAVAPAMPAVVAKSQTLEQTLARARERFAAADLNQDGRVTTEELEQARADRDVSAPRWGAGGRLMRADTDGDGEITLADVEAHARKRFASLDANKDGVLTRDETAAARRRAS